MSHDIAAHGSRILKVKDCKRCCHSNLHRIRDSYRNYSAMVKQDNMIYRLIDSIPYIKLTGLDHEHPGQVKIQMQYCYADLGKKF